MSLSTALLRLRQATYARAFRIAIARDAEPPVILAEAIRELLERARLRIAEAEASAARPPPVPPTNPTPGPPAAGGLAERLAVELCNEVFRLRRNAEQLEKESKESKELLSIRRTGETLAMLLGQHGVQYFDLTGRNLDERDNDFEQFGKPEDVPGLEGKKIGRCERPLVKIHGKIVQRARGIVQRPV